MDDSRPLRLAVIAGEESGQLLAAECVDGLRRRHPAGVALAGVGGDRLQAMGLKSLFDPGEIALMGVSAVLAGLPRLIFRIRQAADAIVAFRPDCVLLVDSPDFSLRVARRIKGRLPDTPVVKYVAPTVWGWRPGRAAAMRSHVDHVLAVLPFEPDVLARLGGPPTTYVGHRTATDPFFGRVRDLREAGRDDGAGRPTLLVLPGSRRSEVGRLAPHFGKAMEVLAERGHAPRIVVPTVAHVAPLVRQATAGWPFPIEIVEGDDNARLIAFANARAALAASGTVTLELAMADIPAVSCYVVDPVMRLFTGMITAWTAALPNLIADEPVIPEYINESIRPGMLARRMEQLLGEGHHRAAQLQGYATVRDRMAVAVPPAERAADIILSLARERSRALTPG